jgi:hypothetical protein
VISLLQFRHNLDSFNRDLKLGIWRLSNGQRKGNKILLVPTSINAGSSPYPAVEISLHHYLAYQYDGEHTLHRWLIGIGNNGSPHHTSRYETKDRMVVSVARHFKNFDA